MSFKSQVQKWSQKTKKNSREIVSDVFINLSTRIVSRTPVGDPMSWEDIAHPSYEAGTLKNSWFAGVGTPSGLNVRSPNTTGADALSNIKQIAPLVFGNVAYLANPAPYATRIEYTGWSKQAPAGMVRITLQEFKDIVKQAANVVN